MSFFDMFTSNPPPAPVQTPATPTVPVEPAQAHAPAIPSVPTPAPSPLDEFSGLWKNEPTPEPTPILGNIDPAKFAEISKQLNFASILPSDAMTKIGSGGVEAQQAFAESMNAVAQAVFAQSAHASTKIVEQALSRQEEAFSAKLPELIRRHAVSDSLRNENPALNHPAAEPIMAALQQQLTRKYPNATAQEIGTMSRSYLKSFAEVITPQSAAPTGASSTKKGEVLDWDALFSQ